MSDVNANKASGRRMPVIDAGRDLSPATELIRQFARTVDLSDKDVRSVIAGNTDGINGRKVTALTTLIEKRFGSLGEFQRQYGALEAAL